MRRFHKYASIKAKVLFSFGIITAVLIAGSLGGYIAKEKNKKIRNVVELAYEQKKLIGSVTRKSLEYVIQEGQTSVRDGMVSMLRKADDAHAALLNGEGGVSALTEEEQKVLAELSDTYTLLKSQIEDLLSYRQEEITVEDGDLLLLLGDIILSNKSIEPHTDTLIEHLNTRAKKANSITLWIFFSATLLAALISIAAIMGSRRIVTRFNEMRKGLTRLREADLSGKITVGAKDELGEIGEALNSVISNLSTVVRDVQEAAHYLASTSEELSATCTGTVNGSEEQAVRITNVSTAMREMAATVMDMANNAASVAEGSKHSTTVAVQGKDKMQALLQKMEGINFNVIESSTLISELNDRIADIVEIVSSINDIADQTNLLALNAAIEAARAGDQGRGFAVVADEVRKLAERTISMTTQIGTTIKGIGEATTRVVTSMETEVQEVKKGVEFANDADMSLRAIESNVQNITERITQIATASEEHSTVSEDISSDIEAISTITANNANNVKEVTSAAHELSNLSARLQQLVSKFTLDARAAETGPGEDGAGNGQNDAEDLVVNVT